LKIKNATSAPHNVIATAFSPAGAPGMSRTIVANAMADSPPARPSIPSVRLTALAVPTIATMASGKISHGVAGRKS